jgi:beta-glucosidase/6-phospho-beta-glucosidase/beta-galactosidase
MKATANWTTGFESTHLFGARTDVLDRTGHARLWAEDLVSVAAHGVTRLRYPAPWHRIERIPGQCDWSWMDPVMAHMDALGLEPIIDPLQRTAFPDWLSQGLGDDRFEEVYVRFVERFAARYPHVRHYTPINEPYLTALLCGWEGVWHPHQTSDLSFVRMLRQASRAICRITHLLKRNRPDTQIVQVGTCEHHAAGDDDMRAMVADLNERRFLINDIVLGRVDRDHAMWGYLHAHGFTHADVEYFAENRAIVDVIGLDYYPHSEKVWTREGVTHLSPQPRGFAAVAADYIDRYRLPVMLSETNMRGLVTDRLTWLKHMAQQCEAIVQRGHAFEGACWFPWVDSTDWSSAVCRSEACLDPIGIIWLHERSKRRHESELSFWFDRLARGEATSADLPARSCETPWDGQLDGFRPLMGGPGWAIPRSAAEFDGPVTPRKKHENTRSSCKRRGDAL